MKERFILPPELEPLRSRKQWVLWKLEQIPGRDKPGKIPYSPITGNRARANDPGTWADFDTAAGVLERDSRNFFDGIGIEFADGLYGIDLDHVLDIVGRITDRTAEQIIATADSYTELSPSGTGVHILMLGKKPEGKCKQEIAPGIVAEMYDTGRFFTVTGKPYGSRKPIQERTAQGAAVHALMIQAGEALKAQRQQDRPQTPQDAPRASQTALGQSDSEILQRMFQSAKGAGIYALWNGDMSAYGGDHSRADQALCNHLAYWTNGDAARMDQLFRQSALMRNDKWDSRRGSGTYGSMTIAEALKHFTPYAPPTAEQDFAGINQAAGGAATQPGTVPAAVPLDVPLFPNAPTAERPHPDSVSHYLTAAFDQDINDFQKYRDRKTGLFNLDDQIGSLYPGLYVVGAISSLGKTTFIHQIGDNLAAAGEHVLFFSLEQSRLEMTLKSISRETAYIAMKGYQMTPNATGGILRNIDLSQRGAVSAISIRRGSRGNMITQARQQYAAKVGDRLNVIECNFNTSVEAISDYITRYMKQNNVKPVVIVDYLQIVPASDPRMDERRKTDHIIRGLKKLQADNDLLIFVVSALNRSNYLAPIDFESFKESGGIEYTADVVWGLQLSAIHGAVFDSDKKIKEKRETIRRAKAAIPRSVELVCLKNRYGVSSYSCLFDYDPVHDLFLPSLDATPTP